MTAKQTNLRHCRECGEQFRTKRIDAEFCSTPCRRDWNNRRQKRGAELYDLYMTIRHDRPLTEALKEEPGVNLWTLIAQLAASFHAEDERDRGGRKSYQHVPGLIAQGKYAHLASIVVGVDGTGSYEMQRVKK